MPCYLSRVGRNGKAFARYFGSEEYREWSHVSEDGERCVTLFLEPRIIVVTKKGNGGVSFKGV